MAPALRRQYYTTHGGPPQGGRAPGMPPRHAQPPYAWSAMFTATPFFPTFCPPPQAQDPPPAYTPTLPQPSPLMVPVFSTPTWYSGPPQTPAPPVDNDYPYPPGSKLDGSRPRFDNGEWYIFPTKHTTFHIVEPLDYKPWERPQATFRFQPYRCPTNITIKELIRQVVQKVGEDESKAGVVEMLERGGGVWTKGSEFHLDEDKSKQTLASIGWDEERGTARKPIWLFAMSE